MTTSVNQIKHSQPIFLNDLPPYQRPSEEILTILRQVMKGIIAGEASLKKYITEFCADEFPGAIWRVSESDQEIIKTWWKNFDKSKMRDLRQDIYQSEKPMANTMYSHMLGNSVF